MPLVPSLVGVLSISISHVVYGIYLFPSALLFFVSFCFVIVSAVLGDVVDSGLGTYFS